MSENSPNELIKLDTAGDVTRWCQHRMSHYSSAKEGFVLTTILLLGFIGGPALVFYLMSWLLAGNLGTSGGGAMALAFNGLLYFLLLALTVLLGWMALRSICRPTHLALGRDGLYYEYHTAIGNFKGQLFPWTEIERIEIFKPGSSINPEHYLVRFRSRSKKRFDLPLRWLRSPDTKDLLAGAVDSHLTDVERDLDVAFFLQSPSVNSFTELWFQSLDSPVISTSKPSSTD
ncbi:MAG: hypothetical protein C5B53_02875 [Candidatus Melainabacteria bacterium]|nr:MAG: hypothetical protein C5B53_02875 [Candidatus Melainabacteria bacterium]